MPEFVRVRLPETEYETSCTREYAEVMKLDVLDEPALARGRVRPATRKGGRPFKPVVNVPRAIPTPKTSGNPAGGESGGVAAEKSQGGTK